MKYLKRFNEGLFSNHSTDQEIAEMVYQQLLYKNFKVAEINGMLTALDIKLDEHIGTYNIASSQKQLFLEYYKLGRLLFKKELDCDFSTKIAITNLLKEKI